MKIYGKETVIRLLSAMSGAKRFPHTIIFTGEAGVGKNTAAKYAAMLMMCENVKTENGLSAPCGDCRACRRIENRGHPDIIYPAVSGKSNIYSRETMRNIVPDSYVKPNDADIKIYIFEHFEDTEAASQNVLLKVIEDPPEGVRFIFTANKKSAFIPTILSRAVTISIPETTPEVTEKALRDTGKYAEAEIKLAAESFPGNIGQGILFLEGGKIAAQREICINIINAVINTDEYALLHALSTVGENRSDAREVIAMAIKVIRDAAIIIAKDDAPLIGCYKSGAAALAAGLTKRRAADMYDKFAKTALELNTNVNVSLTFSALAAKLHT
jgi:DNA polymerase III gamma/tau subunit